MNLKEEILSSHSKDTVNKVVAWVGTDKKRFKELFELFYNGDKRLTQCSSWSLSNVCEKNATLILPYMQQLILKVQEKDVHAGVKRNVTKILHDIEIPEEWEGEVMNLSFNFAEDPEMEIATKCNALTTLVHLAKKYPEIKNEIIYLMDNMMKDSAPPSLCARKKSVMKILSKVNAP